jgi:hypothetical protein
MIAISLLDGLATADDAVRVLCKAFADYPVMRSVADGALPPLLPLPYY